MSLRDRSILHVVTGGIAAYKAAEVVRLLVKQGARVQVAMTAAASRFIQPLTLQTLSGRPVADDLFDLTQLSEIGHIQLARDADLVLVAPCTAGFIGRLAAGLADDLATAALLAARADLPVLLAPAMNTAMWENPLVARNVRTLLETGRYHLVGPAVGELATRSEGEGIGRMSEPEEVMAALVPLLGVRDLAGTRVMVTAGPTREPIDPVRFISNRSTGRMGYAIAAEAAARGATVILVSGPAPGLEVPGGDVERVSVETAEQMHTAVLARAGHVDVVVKAAAVADWRPANVARQKMKKGDGPPDVSLAPTTDILEALLAARRDGCPVLVGFAAETDNVQVRAQEKLARKPVDLLVVNDISDPSSGFGTETNRVTLMTPGGEPEALPLLTKREVAARVLTRVVALLPQRAS